MQVICLEEPAFFALMDKWISGEEAMQKLRITSKTTLQKFRHEGRIRFTQPDRKIILYDNDSINE